MWLRPEGHRAYSAVTLGVRCDGGRSRHAGKLAGASPECKRTATRPPQTRKAAAADSAGAAVVPRGSSYGSRGAVGGPVTTESPCIDDVGLGYRRRAAGSVDRPGARPQDPAPVPRRDAVRLAPVTARRVAVAMCVAFHRTAAVQLDGDDLVIESLAGGRPVGHVHPPWPVQVAGRNVIGIRLVRRIRE